METYKDIGGRLAIVVIENDIEKFIVANVYVPCDSVAGLVFIESVYDKLYEIMDRHTDAFLIMGGDFNMCMDKDTDSINRDKSVNECMLTDYIRANNDKCEIVDSYKLKVESEYWTILKQYSLNVFSHTLNQTYGNPREGRGLEKHTLH